MLELFRTGFRTTHCRNQADATSGRDVECADSHAFRSERELCIVVSHLKDPVDQLVCYMALERVPYPGSAEYQYDSLPGLGDRFSVGHRNVEHVQSALRPLTTSATDHSSITKPVLENVTASATQAQDAVETEVHPVHLSAFLILT